MLPESSFSWFAFFVFVFNGKVKNNLQICNLLKVSRGIWKTSKFKGGCKTQGFGDAPYTLKLTVVLHTLSSVLSAVMDSSYPGSCGADRTTFC